MEDGQKLSESIKEAGSDGKAKLTTGWVTLNTDVDSTNPPRSTTTMEQAPLVNTKNGPAQYLIKGGSDYYLIGEIATAPKLAPGCYTPGATDSGYFLRTVSVNTDRLLKLPYKVFHDVLRDLAVFWDSVEEFKEYGLVHKRGILLHGPPGAGKSSLVLLIQKLIIEQLEGIVVTVTSKSDLECFIGFMESGFRQVEPDTPVVVLLEDIDGLVSSSSTEAVLLQVLDGAKQINNIVYLATTNYLHQLPARLTNRPSRFDRVYEIGFPDAAIRKFYLDNIILEKDKHKVDFDKWVKQTDGFTFAHLRDMIVSILLLKVSFEETIDHLRGLATKAKASGKEGDIGFGKALAKKGSMEYYQEAVEELQKGLEDSSECDAPCGGEAPEQAYEGV